MIQAKQDDLIDSRILQLLLDKLTEYGKLLKNNKIPDKLKDQLNASDASHNIGIGVGIVAVCDRLKEALETGEFDPSRVSGKFDPKYDAIHKDACARKIVILDEAE